MNQSIPRLLGHSFGDGYIHRAKWYFVYTNNAEELHDEVKESVSNIFGRVSHCRRTSISGTPQVQFSPVVGKKLNDQGGPQGSKIRQGTIIPPTMTNGDEATIANFLGALCDDEAQIRTDSGSKQIALKSVKISSLEAELEAYLNQIREMFESLGVSCSAPKRDRTYVRRGETRISKRIWITSSTNFATFARKIVLNHSEKRARLQTLL